MRRRALWLPILCLAVCALCWSVRANAAAPYYRGKTITMIVGFSPGGGYDRLSRILAKYMPKYIPGEPTIVVQNVPGAGTMIAANQIYNLTKPDGLTFGIFNRGLPFAQLLKADGVKFDLRKYSWVGSAAVETATLAVRTDLPFKALTDLLKAKESIMIGSGGGPSDSNTQFIILLCLDDSLSNSLDWSRFRFALRPGRCDHRGRNSARPDSLQEITAGDLQLARFFLLFADRHIILLTHNSPFLTF